jgi:Pyruvate/2-oxoacid:ferredoxin oxidoreductase delta subunit
MAIAEARGLEPPSRFNRAASIVVSHALCDGCGLCIESCPVGALVYPGDASCAKCVKYCSVMDVPCLPARVVLVDGRCDGCGVCESICPRHAISMAASQLNEGAVQG